MPLHDEQLLRVRELFADVYGLDPSERAARLADEGDLQVRAEVEALLTNDAPARGLLPSMATTAETAPSNGGAGLAPVFRRPESIGRFRITGVLGSGGMGVVYRAEQEQPRREVALKVMRAGLVSRYLLRRFEHEVDALGRLQHPGIAQIFEAGTHDDGTGPQPFFAMELVDGVPLLEFARRKKLGVEQRVALLAEICAAVQHAHQKGVIHRDIKPGNVLVDGHGRPRVLDFGVARFTGDEPRRAFETLAGQLVGTLAYMSPEQVSGDPDGVDTRTDVYSLGVVGYELLAGRPPHEVEGKPLTEVVRWIREVEPARPSTWDPALRGDIETILGKALEKDKERRYATVSDLQQDLLRLLRFEPIAAHPPSTFYQLTKFARRHRALVLGVAATIAVLVLGLIERTRQVFRAREAEARAILEGQRARAEGTTHAAVVEYLRRLLLAMEPGAIGPTVTIDGVLDFAASQTSDEFAEQPVVRAAIDASIGSILVQRGRFAEAERLLVPARAKLIEAFGEEHAHVVFVTRGLAELYRDSGRPAEALPLARKVLAETEKLRGPDHLDTIGATNDLFAVLVAAGEYDEADRLGAPLLERAERVLGVNDVETLRIAANRANLLVRRGRGGEAEPEFRRIREALTPILGKDHHEVLNVSNSLAAVLLARGDGAGAEPLLREILPGYERALGKDYVETLGVAMNLASAIRLQGRFDEASIEWESLEARLRAAVGDDHPNVALAACNLGELALELGDPDEAIARYAPALDRLEAALGREHPHVVQGKAGFVRALHATGDVPRALTVIEDALPSAVATFGEVGSVTHLLATYRVQCLHDLGRDDEALAAQRDRVTAFDRAGELDTEEGLETLIGRAQLEAALGDSPAARITAQDAVARATRAFGEGDPRTSKVRRRAARFDGP